MREPKYKQLSTLVDELPNGLRPMQYIKRLRQAICQGKIQGTYIATYFQPKDTPERRRGVQDMMILIDPTFNQWSEEAISSMRVIKGSNRAQWPQGEDIITGNVDFEEAAARTRKLIEQHTNSGAALGRSGSGNATKKAAKPPR